MPILTQKVEWKQKQNSEKDEEPLYKLMNNSPYNKTMKNMIE